MNHHYQISQNFYYLDYLAFHFMPQTLILVALILHDYSRASRIAEMVRICLQCGRPGFDRWVRKIPWSREWQPTPVFLPGESHGQRSLVGYRQWVTKSWIRLSDLTPLLCIRLRGMLTKHNNFMMTILHLGISDVLLSSQALSHPFLNLRLKKNSREN